MKRLGKVTKTARGFQIIEFRDIYGNKASLQQSSLAKYQQPGTSAVWLGCDSEGLEDSRMHLDRNQVRGLINHLEEWLKRGTFRISPK